MLGKRNFTCRKALLREKGFTLIELLVVMIILGLLATLVGPRIFKNVSKSKLKTAKTQISLFENALAQFKLDIGRFPSTGEGLRALRTNSGISKWDGPYIMKDIPKDPWDREYIYNSPGEAGRPYDIMSYGLDGSVGGDGENKDTKSWE